MMPKEIMETASLMVNEHGDIKLAITILSEINKNTYQPVGSVKLLFTKIRVEKANALSYTEAGNSENETIFKGLQISNALQEMRSKKTKGVVLNELSNSYPKES